MKIFKKHILLGVIFITGACVLVIEIVALRILSPYYGNTIFSASSVITVILAALSIGYYVGGRLADKRPSAVLFYNIIFASGVAVLSLELLSAVLLPFLGQRLSLVSGPLISSVLLFSLPGVLLGMLSPFVIKLQSLRMPKEGIGTIVGKVFFWSTFGSITGSLAAGFFFIPRFGVNEIMIGTGIVLSGIGVWGTMAAGTRKEMIVVLIAVVGILTGSLYSTLSVAAPNIVHETDGLYEKIVVYEGDYERKPVRFLRQDWSSSSAMFLDSEELVYEYTKYYKLYKIFTPNPKEVLSIGAGAYSVPKAFLRELPRVSVDVVEIEPVLVEIGKLFFRVPDDPRLTHYIEDGRRFLRNSEKQYDIIFSDVYVSSIPAHFATREFFEIAKSKLAPEGIFIANIVGDLSPRSQSFVFSEMKTLQSVFPQSYFFAVQSSISEEPQNIIFVGHQSDKDINLEDFAKKNPTDQFISELPAKLINPYRFDLTLYPLLTDNFAPVEYLYAEMWRPRK